jgi:hypothetical protein
MRARRLAIAADKIFIYDLDAQKTVKTLAGFDFAFQPSLDRQRILRLPS